MFLCTEDHTGRRSTPMGTSCSLNSVSCFHRPALGHDEYGRKVVSEHVIEACCCPEQPPTERNPVLGAMPAHDTLVLVDSPCANLARRHGRIPGSNLGDDLSEGWPSPRVESLGVRVTFEDGRHPIVFPSIQLIEHPRDRLMNGWHRHSSQGVPEDGSLASIERKRLHGEMWRTGCASAGFEPPCVAALALPTIDRVESRRGRRARSRDPR